MKFSPIQGDQSYTKGDQSGTRGALLDTIANEVITFGMEDTYTIKTLQRGTAAAVERAASGRLVTITRHDRPVAVMLSHARLSALVETMEILSDPKAMKALRAAKAGKVRYTPLSKLPD